MDMDACTAYSIRRMEKKDMAQSVALTDLMDWGLTEEDFAFNIGLEPGGCFVAVSEGERVVGVITSVAYGKVGWVGNVIVHPRRRDSGIGAALVSHALDHLTMRGVVTTGLYGYRNVVHFYERLGFRVSRPFSWMSCKTVSWMGEVAPSAEPTDIQAIVELDERCFGAPRQRLLREILFNNVVKAISAEGFQLAFYPILEEVVYLANPGLSHASGVLLHIEEPFHVHVL